MNELNLEIVKVVFTFLTVIGILISLWLSQKALRQVIEDRRIVNKPFLLFEHGGFHVEVEFKKVGKFIPGIEPIYVKKVLAHLPDDIESVRIKDWRDKKNRVILGRYGELRNLGNGTAIGTHVTFVAKSVRIGSELFELDKNKRGEAIYSKVLNTIPCGHITKGEYDCLHRLPTFIEKDFEKKIAEVHGVLEIEFDDVIGNTYLITQEFSTFTQYVDNPPNITMTFGDFIGESMRPKKNFTLENYD